MELVACHCNWDIPGVESLPAHNHVSTGEYEPGSVFERGPFKGQRMQRAVMDPYKIHIWVNWKDIARELSVVA